jgi:gamma-glutamyl phosphate reductase
MIGGADIDIVPTEGAADAVPCPLREAAEVLADAAGDEGADLVDGDVVVDVVVGRGRRRLVAVLTKEATAIAESGLVNVSPARIV